MPYGRTDNPWEVLFDIPVAIVWLVDTYGMTVVLVLFGCVVYVGLLSMLPALLVWVKKSTARQGVGAQVDAVHQVVATMVMIPVVVFTCGPMFWSIATKYPHRKWPMLGALAVVLVLLALLDRMIKRQSLAAKQTQIATFCRWTGTQESRIN